MSQPKIKIAALEHNLVQNSVSVDYTFVLSDADSKHVFHPTADVTARIFTIAANTVLSFPIGSELVVVNQHGAGVLTIEITTDTMRLVNTELVGNRTLAANGIARIIKITDTEWIIRGDGLT